MSSDTTPYDEFKQCFNASFSMIVSLEELQEKMTTLNRWLEMLCDEERREVAHEIETLILKAQESLSKKQIVLEETILANNSQMKANSYYGKY
ncbi:hypothetical protein ACFDTO_15555 [Microbacteriaceae bacterium 4G12]